MRSRRERRDRHARVRRVRLVVCLAVVVLLVATAAGATAIVSSLASGDTLTVSCSGSRLDQTRISTRTRRLTCVGRTSTSSSTTTSSSTSTSTSTSTTTTTTTLGTPPPPGACPLASFPGLPPRDGIINGVHTRPDDPLAPDACRSGLDSAHPESSLKPVTNTAFMALLKKGVTLSGYSVTGCIEVAQDNVTIENTVITCKAMDRFDGSAMIVAPSGLTVSGLTLRHLDLRCLGPGDVDHACMAIIGNWGFGHGLFENIAATGISGGIGGGGTGGDATGPLIVQQNWFHDFVAYVSADGTRATHDDGVYLQGTGAVGPQPNIVIRHNVIDMTAVNQTVTAEIADADSGLIDANWLWGAGYTVYVNPATGYTATHTNNWMQKGQWGFWHFASQYNPPGVSVCAGNRDYLTSQPLPDRCW